MSKRLLAIPSFEVGSPCEKPVAQFMTLRLQISNVPPYRRRFTSSVAIVPHFTFVDG